MKRAAIILALLLIACSDANYPLPVADQILSWNPPTTWTDNTFLDPYFDIERNDIMCSESGIFTDNDVVASVSGVDNGVVVDSFNLSLILPYLGPEPTYVSVRTWAWDNLVSDFAAPVWWEK